MAEKDIPSRVRALVRDCEDYRDERSQDRLKAMAFYDGDPTAVPFQANRSSVVTRDVRAAIKKVLPAITRVILGGDKVVEYQPVGQNDEQTAQQASDYVNLVIMDECGVRQAIHDAVMDALKLRNGILHWYVDTKIEIKTSEHSGLDEMAFAQLVEPDDVEVLEHSARQEMVDGPQGQMPITVHDVKIRRKSTKKNIRVAARPPEEFLIHSDAVTLEDSPIVGVKTKMRRTDLVAMGYDAKRIRELPISEGDESAEEFERLERRDVIEGRDGDDLHWTTQEIDYYELYVRIDQDDDGIAELRRIVYAGSISEQNELENDECDEVPFASIVCERQPHQWEGVAISDDLIELQRIKTVLLRNTLDNLYWQNNLQPAIQEGAVSNPEAVLNPEFGLPIRIKQGFNVRDAVQYQVVPFVAKESFSMLEYLDAEAADRTGINDASNGLAPDALQNMTAKASAMIEQGGVAQTEMMVRTIADGLRTMFQGLLRLVIRHQDKPRTVKLRGEWVEFDPRHWNAEMDASINVGLGAGTRERDMMMMQMIIGLQERIVAALGPDNPFVKPENVYNSFEELVRAAGIKTPDRFVTNPDPQEVAARLEMARNKPDPEMIKANAAMQVEQMKAQIAMQVKQADMEVQTNKERAQMEADLRVKAAEMEKDAIARREQLEADAIKEEQKANLEREKMAQARELKLLELAQQRELAVMSSGVEQAESGVQQVIEAIQMLTNQIEGIGARDSAPRRIVRDPVTGDIVGVEVDGGSARRVVRDPASGDIIGVETIQ